jgi:hypothetical protein
MLSYHVGDSTPCVMITADLGIHPTSSPIHWAAAPAANPDRDRHGGDRGRMCHTAAIFRAMNGYSALRQGGTGIRPAHA